LVAITALFFVGGASVLAVTCPRAEDIEKWGRAFLNQPEDALGNEENYSARDG
jgi:hypothetical protein